MLLLGILGISTLASQFNKVSSDSVAIVSRILHNPHWNGAQIALTERRPLSFSSAYRDADALDHGCRDEALANARVEHPSQAPISTELFPTGSTGKPRSRHAS